MTQKELVEQLTDNKPIDRRQFIRDAGLTLGLAYLGFNAYQEVTYDKNEQELYDTIDQYVHLITNKSKIKIPTNKKDESQVIDVISSGHGIAKDGLFYTCYHCANVIEYSRRTMFGTIHLPFEVVEHEVTINDIAVEGVAESIEKDVAIFRLPKHYNLPEIPYRFGNPELGQDIYVTGNPAARGMNIRKGMVGDMDGFDSEEHMFGYNVPLIGGDSGTPIISDKFEVVGLSQRVYMGVLGYGVYMKEFQDVARSIER